MRKNINPQSLKVPSKQYSHGVLIGVQDASMLFITGQLPQDKEGKILCVGDIASQTKLVFKNILHVLEDAEMNYQHLVKIQIFLKSAQHIDVVSKIRDSLFAGINPASTLLIVQGFAREGAEIEVDAIAVRHNKTD